MKRRIEQEIDQTLNCLNESDGIEVSSLFIDTVSDKIGHLRTRRGIGYRNKAFYPVVIILMIVSNLTVLAAVMAPQQSSDDGQTVDQTSVIASEYGIDQNAYAAF